jgi:chemotaxis protein methyltransferase CheR
MRDEDCVGLLQWALPRLGLSWPGFRRVRRQVCRRLERRLREVGLEGAAAYRAYLEEHPEEWQRLDTLCRVTVSRFFRDRGVFEALGEVVLPALAAQASSRGLLRAWSAGCASGEEPYTLAALWEHAVRPVFPHVELRILATDADEAMLRRAGRAVFGASSVREVPTEWRRRVFTRRGERYHVRPRLRELVSFAAHDVRDPPPSGPFDLALCRNLAFTYFDEAHRLEVAGHLARALRLGGALVVGAHESLPEGAASFVPWLEALGVYRRATPREAGATLEPRRPRSSVDRAAVS